MSVNEGAQAYLKCLLWTGTLLDDIIYEGDTYKADSPLDDLADVSDLPEHIVEAAEEACQDFADYCMKLLGIDPFEWFDAEQVGHDFALSRNGHGSGFFDREYVVTTRCAGESTTEDLADKLQDAARTFGSHALDAWVEDGKLNWQETS